MEAGHRELSFSSSHGHLLNAEGARERSIDSTHAGRRTPARGPVGARGATALVASWLALAGVPAWSQSGDPTPPLAPNGAPAQEPASGGPGQRLAPVQITGSRPDDVQERRSSTAAKIVIGRDEIERFGDSTLGEVLRRLPGVTIQGRPGRGGAIRMRGLGSGYTQILLDGERVPPGFSLDSIAPEQIERIEILRAPSAETGARAIAGTINIVTRAGFGRRVNDVRASAGLENGKLQPSASWTRDFTGGPFAVNTSLSAFGIDRDHSSTTSTVARRLDDGSVTLAQLDEGRLRVGGGGINATSRLRWRAGDGADAVTLTPIVFANRFHSRRDGTLVQTAGSVPAPYDEAATTARTGTSLVRLQGEWLHRLAPEARFESRAGIGRSRSPAHSFRTERTSGTVSRTLEETSDSRDTSITASGKLAATVFGSHSLVSGVEVESNRRADTRTSLQDGSPILTDFADSLSASTVRFAAYAQDEWSLSEQWAAHAGLRWEAIRTRGSVEDGAPEATNRSSVWTPLLHAVWKPDPKGRDQVRISLTRSYRAPSLASLIARPSVNTRYPVPGPNTPTQPDRAGNPGLAPELATGVDVAVERYLAGSGLLSANVFHRRIRNYMRSVTTLEDVSYASEPRWVTRSRNVGNAVTEGVELEAKFRASDVFDGAPRIDLRANASVFRSRVEGVPGPDNRVDQQPRATVNVGADHRFAGVPLAVGGNVHWTPGTTTRVSESQSVSVGRKLVVDAYGLWTVSPTLALRLSFSNLDPHDYTTGSALDGPALSGALVRETSETRAPTFLNVQLRVEMKL
ncbi:MAG: TonB-dependent receptor plug domain-containing protein [Caldimonas sp.]